MGRKRKRIRKPVSYTHLDNQTITIGYKKGAKTTTPMVDNGNGTGSFDLVDGDGNKRCV